MPNLISLPIFIFILIYSIILHEVAHGLVADYLGDPTARLMKRLTLNPFPHIDPIGSILLPLLLIVTGSNFLFGWAKPVPFDPFNLKNPRRDSALISLAGPATNLFIALVGSILMRLLIFIELPVLSTIGMLILPVVIIINISLAVFNLLPIAPLDGFKIVGGILSEHRAKEWYELERYGFIFLMILLISPGLLNIIVGPVINFLRSLLLPGSYGGFI
ncbi:hypothetical protein A2866_01890 [Candidatus Roizmanbacteria bacterium RIFCSPHIGHO2_01_FULL_39_8]|uniref:Peptidase M50 domain-containing protein n=3 Tax=Candidatus Roizmaniibacteriota TaxID=1752723 RepID=A0A1F7GRI2_9BACT|nr:MAG: hypothetical protein A2866_01890 [Candidatus Roizmanbacteria bacterium RIFCSPHIGHO2_01_FULL_39_8]OGK27770.1 MAG: hypothetical protein A3C28_03915 [Candidatus Roizmanbacteria bacterium RIFCSPHIGHO2_02_FULL_39_9]OGK38090.1 MAG: hypothetical protein A3F60_03535 [Candidatus Roizmanbacteria bacterium RIFCSPHIGHO2_12_FULL_39_8]